MSRTEDLSVGYFIFDIFKYDAIFYKEYLFYSWFEVFKDWRDDISSDYKIGWGAWFGMLSCSTSGPSLLAYK